MRKGHRLYEASDVCSGARVCVRLPRRLVVTTLTIGGLLLGVGSCGQHDHAVGTDASVDAQIEMTITPPNCKMAGTVCHGKEVHVCVGGQEGDVVDICAQACSLGRCTTMACADAEHHDGTRGCRFYGVQMDNVDGDDGHKLMLILGNASMTTTATAVVTARDSGGGRETLTSAVVPPRGGARIEINRPVLGSGVTPGAAYRVDSDSPVLAIEIVSDDVDRASRSSGGTVLRPLQVLGQTHLAVTFPQKGSPGVLQTLGSRGGAGAIAVVATAPATTVRIGLTSAAILDPGGPTDPRPTPTEVMMMNEGDVLQIFSVAPDGDLTGTSIDADAPVAVFSGNVFTTYDYDVTGFNGGDLAMEQLPPTTSWSSEYIGAHLSPQSGCGPFFGAGSGLWSVVAAEDGTDVMLEPAAGVTIEALGLPSVLSFPLGRGGVRTFFARPGLDPSVSSDFVVRSDKPILLAQWLDCEPGLSWGIDTHLSNGDLAFALPPGFDHEVIVVRRTGTPVTFDGRSLEDTRFTSTTLDDGEFQLARVPASELGPCVDLLDPCQHEISGRPAFGISWRGMDVVCSYALTVPPTKVCAPPNITCIP